MLFFLLLLFLDFAVAAQKPAEGNAAAYKIYEDLPLNEPGEQSVLKPKDNIAKKINDNIFIKTTLSKKTCFVGEPVKLVYQLFSALLNKSELAKSPSFQGFTVQEIATVNDQGNYQIINNKNYRVFTVAENILTPYETGTLHLAPVVINNTIYYEDDNGEKKEYAGSVASVGAAVSVLPLPALKKKGLFSGAIGQFSISLKLDKTVLAANESNRVVIEIRGNGNLSAFSLPFIKWPATVEMLEPDIMLKTDSAAADFYTEKIFTAAVIASQEGKFTIDPLRVVIFNPAEGRYEEIVSQPVEMLVHKSSNPAAGTSTNVLVPAAAKSYTWIYIGGCAAVLLLFSLAVILRRANRAKTALSQKAAAIVPAPMPVNYGLLTEDALSRTDDAGFLQSFHAVIKQYLAEKTNGGMQDSDENLLARFSYLSPQDAGTVGSLLAECNRLLYAPGQLQAEKRAYLADAFLAVVNR